MRRRAADALAAVKVMLAAGAAADRPNKQGATALMGAAENGHDLCVRALLEAGANPDGVGQPFACERGGVPTPLHVSVCHSLVGSPPMRQARLRCTQLLVEAGASIATVSPQDGNVLMHAVQHAQGLNGMVSFLLNHLGRAVQVDS
jgi:ankyrin repeat protein